MGLKDKEIVLGVSGGIACYKSLEIVRSIRTSGGNVSVVMTEAAREFVQPLTFQTLSGRSVATSMFSLSEESKIGHIKIGENAHALLIAPATANIIAKAAHGIADDYLSTVLLACQAPLIVAPAMNANMWNHPAVQDNLMILKSRGATIVQPDFGFQACGTYGPGRMADPARIIEQLTHLIGANITATTPNRSLSGVSVLVTAGPTREKIDAVRYLTNYSSGKMGYALAAACRRAGASVTLISGPTNLSEPIGVTTLRVTSANDMHQAVMKAAEAAHLIIKTAAVSDFRIENPNPQKTKKTDTLTLSLVKNPDILKELGQKKQPHQFLVGFAAESQDVEAYARQKLEEKNLDLIVANNILQKDAGFDSDTNRVLLIDQENRLELPLLNKEEVAERIVDHITSHPRWHVIRESIQRCEP